MIPPWLDIALRSAVVYAALLIGLRLLGKGHLSQMSVPDLVLLLLLSNSVQNAMVGNDSSLAGGLIAAAVLIILNFLITKVVVRSRKAGAFIEGAPAILIRNGRVIAHHLEREGISQDELEQAVREHGVGELREVRLAMIEQDGTISVIPASAPETHIRAFVHRRLSRTRKTSP